MREYRLFDVVPATRLLDSIPVGNGRMGGTLMCGVSEEVMFLNEETVWASQYSGNFSKLMWSLGTHSINLNAPVPLAVVVMTSRINLPLA